MKLARIGGWCLILAAVLFIGVFSWLAANFDYPDILDRSAGEVLPRLLALGTTGRAVWTLYAFIPLLLIPAGIGITAAFQRYAPLTSLAAAGFASLAALAMAIGLSRWSTMQWDLALRWERFGDREQIVIFFNYLNLMLGRVLGEFVGEIALNLFFMLTGLVFLDARRPRWQGVAGCVVGAVGFVAAFRNLTPAVGPIAEADNYLLPLWLIVLGVLLARSRESGGSLVTAPVEAVDDTLAVGN